VVSYNCDDHHIVMTGTNVLNDSPIFQGGMFWTPTTTCDGSVTNKDKQKQR